MIEQRFSGGVVADEPRAALIAEAILEAGGTAADAAAALYFALAVTYPVAAGLGAGGACVVYDSVTETTESIDFLPRQAAGGGPIAVPGAVRGFAALHARYGRLRWSQVVLPAESLARFGHPVSRALATRLADSGIVQRAGPGLRESIAPNGVALPEGTMLTQTDLAAVLGEIRTRGGGDLYFGGLARQLAEASAALGGAVGTDDLQRYLPEWKPSSGLRFGDLIIHTNPSPPSGGLLAGTMWAMLLDEGRFRETRAAARTHLLSEVSARAFGNLGATADGGTQISAFRAHTLMSGFDPAQHGRLPAGGPDLSGWAGPGDDGGTGFAVIDRRGSAVACGLSMNGAFGIGRLLPGLGFVPAAAVPEGTRSWTLAGSDFLVSAIVVNNFSGEIIFAGAASGGAAAPAALVQSVLPTILNGSPLAENVAAPRIFQFANPDVTFVEAGYAPEALAAMQRLGHQVARTVRPGRVNAISCVNIQGSRPNACEFVSEARGYGIGTGGAF